MEGKTRQICMWTEMLIVPISSIVLRNIGFRIFYTPQLMGFSLLAVVGLYESGIIYNFRDYLNVLRAKDLVVCWTH